MSGKRRWTKSIRFDSAWRLYRGRDRLASVWKECRFGRVYQWKAKLGTKSEPIWFHRLRDAKAWCMERTEKTR